MEPCSSEHGNNDKPLTRQEDTQGFNGAVLIRARKRRALRPPPDGGSGFNGAVLIRARKPGAIIEGIDGMEVLQWSRAHQSTETGLGARRWGGHSGGFNGAVLIRARKRAWRGRLQATASSFNGAVLIRARKRSRGRAGCARPAACFNGAVLIRARKRQPGRRAAPGEVRASMEPCSSEHGNSSSPLPTCPQCAASMEPCSSEHGNRARLSQRHIARQLQWSRAHQSTETLPARRGRRCGRRRFNGAVLIRARKPSVRSRLPAAPKGFNGAVLIRARKQWGGRRMLPAQPGFNGAVLIRARKPSSTSRGGRCGCWCFNGAVLIRARKPPVHPRGPPGGRAGFNGAVLIRARKPKSRKRA